MMGIPFCFWLVAVKREGSDCLASASIAYRGIPLKFAHTSFEYARH